MTTTKIARKARVPFRDRVSVELNPEVGACWITLDADEQMYYFDRTPDGAELTKFSTREVHTCRVVGARITCNCKGHVYHGRCKHAAAMGHLIDANLI